MAHHHQAMGYHFHPTGREVLKYLLGFARDEPLPDQNQLMHIVDLYADKEPWQIFDSIDNNNNKNTRYFITPTKKKKEDGKRVIRSVGKGTWKLQGKGKEVFDDKGRLMGHFKSLKYTPGRANKSSNNGEWLMTEYSLCNGYARDIKIKNNGFVICKIKKKEKRGDKEKGVRDNENPSDVEEFIDLVLQEEDINLHGVGEEDNEEYVEEDDDIGDQVLAILEVDGDDNVEEYMNSEDNNGITKNVDEYLEGGEHVLAEIDEIDLDAINFVY